MPYTREAVAHVVERVKRVQGTMERPFAVENVSSYMTYPEDEMPEWEFVAEVVERADCGLLLDVNNVYVSAKNHGFDPERYVDAMPVDRIVQMHVAGHAEYLRTSEAREEKRAKRTWLLDSHGTRVREEVWALQRRVLARTGPIATLLEWDEDIPPWDDLAAEARKAHVA